MNIQNVRSRLFNLRKDALDDDQIQLLIDIHTDKLIERYDLTEDFIKQNKTIFDDAVFYSIACEILVTNPRLLLKAYEYDVGDTGQKWSEDAFNSIPNYCDLKIDALDDLLNKKRKVNGVQAFRRRSMSNHSNWFSYP